MKKNQLLKHVLCELWPSRNEERRERSHPLNKSPDYYYNPIVVSQVQYS